MKKILISGYYGFGNIGDEAILQSMIQEFNAVSGVDITVLSQNPDMTQSQFGVKAVDRSKLFSLIKAIRKNDTLISGGGSLLQESTGRLSIFYYLFIYFVALLFRKDIIIFSHGIGPVHRNISKKLIKFVFNRVEHISVRDNQSKVELVSYGIKAEKIHVTADPVLGFESFGKDKGIDFLKQYDGYDPTLPTIGFALKESKQHDISEEIVKTIDGLKQEPCNIVMLPFHFKEDQRIISNVMKASKHNVIGLCDHMPLETVFSTIESFDVLVGVRLHALIFSSVSHTPVVGITYDPKIDAFLESIHEQSICSVDTIIAEVLLDGIYEKLKNYDMIKASLTEDVSQLKERLGVFHQIMTDAR